MENSEEKLIWQSRDEMPYPTNALQKLKEILTMTSRDTAEDKMIACMYGIIVGWDDNSYKELQQTHNWSHEDVRLQKLWHKNFNKAWNLYINQPSTDTTS